MRQKKNKDVITYPLLGFFVLMCVIFTIIYDFPLLDLTIAITGLVYIAVLAERNIFNFLIGFINVVLYIILCYQTTLYGEVIFYLLFDTPISIIAFFSWRKAMKKDFTVQSRKLKPIWWLVLPAATLLFAYLYGFFLHAIGSGYAFIDALATGVTIVATFLLWQRYREQWWGWIAVCLVSIVMWAMAGNMIMVWMDIGTLVFSIKGLWEWYHDAQHPEKAKVRREHYKHKIYTVDNYDKQKAAV